MLPPVNMYSDEHNISASPNSGNTNIAGLFTLHITCERGEIVDRMSG